MSALDRFAWAKSDDGDWYTFTGASLVGALLEVRNQALREAIGFLGSLGPRYDDAAEELEFFAWLDNLKSQAWVDK